MNSEDRNPRAERNPKSDDRMITGDEAASAGSLVRVDCFGVRNSGFFRISRIRISDSSGGEWDAGGTRPYRVRRRLAGLAKTTRQRAVETTALPVAARADARPTGKKVSRFKFEVSSCRLRTMDSSERCNGAKQHTAARSAGFRSARTTTTSAHRTVEKTSRFTRVRLGRNDTRRQVYPGAGGDPFCGTTGRAFFCSPAWLNLKFVSVAPLPTNKSSSPA